MKSHCVLSLALLGALCLLGAEMPSVTPMRQDHDGTWTVRHNQKLQQIKELGGKIQVAWLGDSITHFLETDKSWKDYFCGTPYVGLNLGFGGDRTENLLWRLQNGELDGYCPKCFVLMIGTNNTGDRGTKYEPPSDTLFGIVSVLDCLKEKRPDSKIILCSITPRDYTATTEARKRNESINAELCKFCDGKNIIWCDWGNQMLDPAGRLPADMCYDALHPTAKGYQVWMRNVLPLIAMCCDDNPQPGCLAPKARKEDLWWQAILDGRNEISAREESSIDLAFMGDQLALGFFREGAEARKEVFDDSWTLLNLGFEGDLVENVHWRAKGGELQAPSLSAIFLLAGLNNAKDTPENVAKGLEALVMAAREQQPKARIVLSLLPPLGREPQSGTRQRCESVNAQIKKLALPSGTLLLEDFSKMLDKDGKLKEECSKDGISLENEGYLVIAQALYELIGKQEGRN